MNHLGELRPSSWFRWTVVVTLKKVSSWWEPQIPRGSWIKLSEEDSRRESTFIYLMSSQEPWCSNSRFKVFQMISQKRNSSNWEKWLICTRLLISRLCPKKHFSCLSGNARMPRSTKLCLMVSILLVVLVIQRGNPSLCTISQTENWESLLCAMKTICKLLPE